MNQTELIVGTILFILFFGYIRDMLLGNPINSSLILISASLFFIWYLLTMNISEFLSNL